MTQRIETIRMRTALAGLALALLIALFGAFAVSDTAEAQGNSLSFDDPPTSVSVTSGAANRNVVKVQASGISNQKRIRYSISGNYAFSVTPKTGRVKYDGRSLASGSIELTVTARDRRGAYASASFKLQVQVSAAQACTVGMTLNAGERCALNTTEVIVDKKGRASFRFRCWGGFARCSYSAAYIGYTKNGISVEKRDGNWTITSVP